jgi:hypothetical protein
VQQSAFVVHDAPSSEHTAAHSRAAPCPPQFPVQHWAVNAQAPASAMHDVAEAWFPQRLTAVASPTHPPTPAQQFAGDVQRSPLDPHPLRS